MAKFTMYKDIVGEWRWNFKANNGAKIADSGEGYKNQTDCEAAIKFIKVNAPNAPIESLVGSSRQ